MADPLLPYEKPEACRVAKILDDSRRDRVMDMTFEAIQRGWTMRWTRQSYKHRSSVHNMVATGLALLESVGAIQPLNGADVLIADIPTLEMIARNDSVIEPDGIPLPRNRWKTLPEVPRTLEPFQKPLKGTP